MKPDEEYVLATLASKFGGKYIDGEDPPDGYLLLNNRRIAVEVTKLVEHINENGKRRSRLADDVPISNIVAQLNEEIGKLIPKNRWIHLVIPSPIKRINDFKKELTGIIINMIAIKKYDAVIDILGYVVSINLYKCQHPPKIKVVPAIATKFASTNIQENILFLLENRINIKNKKCNANGDIDEYWLALFNTYCMADIDSYRAAYDSLKLEHNFSKIYLIDGYRHVYKLC
ncbi:hypothetical protein CMT41_09680 [Colwellia sp. MT41]|uniref:Uncharacterized protein n=1 Tax=Colwellia marinimaniae TaxID=1513592 RepID=A0ABQ0MSG5_9GAMM|nr:MULTISPECIES: hypothetical protein [Colwellia]ALO34955.1 hypothetical protein CMT41_09680 [Colwellia sp. MT41]GAW95289.1 hypothetical protein MTCD1_00891 [Colwellia marinimaniae]